MGHTSWYFPYGRAPTSSPELWEIRFKLEALTVNKTLRDEAAKLEALPEEIRQHCLELLGQPLAKERVEEILKKQMLRWRITHPKERQQIEYIQGQQDKLKWE